MSHIGYTSGGSPIFAPLGQKKRPTQSRQLHECSANPRHKLTANQARSNGYQCSHCGSDLKIRKNKIQELHALARSLNMRVIE